MWLAKFKHKSSRDINTFATAETRAKLKETSPLCSVTKLIRVWPPGCSATPRQKAWRTEALNWPCSRTQTLTSHYANSADQRLTLIKCMSAWRLRQLKRLMEHTKKPKKKTLIKWAFLAVWSCRNMFNKVVASETFCFTQPTAVHPPEPRDNDMPSDVRISSCNYIAE